MQRMKRMRQRMDTIFNKGRLPFFKRHPHPRVGGGPMHAFMKHKINKHMKRAHKKLQHRCGEEMSECPKQYGPGLIDCLLSKRRSLSEECSEQLHKMKKVRAKIAKKVYRKQARLLKHVRKVCHQELSELCPNSGRPMVCLVKRVSKLRAESNCHKLVLRTATKWGRFEMWQARKAQLRENLRRACVKETAINRCKGGYRCPFKLLKCLGRHRAALSPKCSSMVSAEQAKHLAERAQRKALRKAHKACKKAFKSAAKKCGSDSEDESDDEGTTPNNTHGTCLSQARATKNACHRDADKMMSSHIKQIKEVAEPVAKGEASATVTYRHQIVTSPGDHCLEITIPGGSDSPFWKAEGWKYSAPDRPEWVEGQCDKAKWKTQDSKTDSYDGYTAAKNSPYDAVFLIKYGLEGKVSIPWFRVNPALQASSQAAAEPQNKPEHTEPPKTREQKKVALKAEARAAHKAQEYEFRQDDQTLVFALVGMLVMFLFVMVYVAVKRRQQKRYALEAMHMTVVESGSDAKDTSPSAPPLPDSAHDQL